MQTGLEHVVCRPRRVTPTALTSTSRIVFIRQDKSRARKVVLENIFGSWVTLACTNSSLVVHPPRPETVVCGRTAVSARFFVAKDIDMAERSRNPGSREWSLRPVIPDTRRKRYGKELRGLSVECLWRCGSRHQLAVPVRL